MKSAPNGKAVRHPAPPAEKLTYDPAKAVAELDLNQIVPPPEWTALIGKVVKARGTMAGTFSRGWPDEPNMRRVAFNIFVRGGITLTCVARLPVDWKTAGAYRTVTVTGILDWTDSNKTQYRLRDSYVTSAEGKGAEEITAEALVAEYSADKAAFQKKRFDWVLSVTGTLKAIHETEISKTLHAYRFVLDGGPMDLHCWLDNELDVDANPPVVGQKVTLLVKWGLFDASKKGPSLNGVYVGKAP